jgi:hypothetical protein
MKKGALLVGYARVSKGMDRHSRAFFQFINAPAM